MHVLSIITPLTLLLPLSLSAPLDTTQTPLDLPPAPDHIPTRYESTILARRLLALSPTGVISSIFPPNHSAPYDHFTPPPSSVASLSISLPDYLSDCDRPSSHGNPILLLLDPSTSSRNSRVPDSDPNRTLEHHHNNISLSLSWWDRYPAASSSSFYSPASLPRLSMIGHLEEIPIPAAKASGIEACYLHAHPDAKWWLPGDPRAAHGGRWMRLRVREVYWMGGFGDRAFIGWLDREEWAGVGRREWEAVRLPGERE